MKAAIFRYCILFQNGGYYFDINKGCDCNITDPHPADAHELITYENNPEIILPALEAFNNIQYPLNAMSQYMFGFIKKTSCFRKNNSNYY